jgi:hypothetical protein
MLTRPAAVQMARELYASGAWNLTQIRAYVAECGVAVSRETIHRWADDDYARRAGERQRRSLRDHRGSAMNRVVDADAIIRRVTVLHEAGMEVLPIRIALRVDYDLRISGQSVRHIIETGELPVRLGQIVRNRLVA